MDINRIVERVKNILLTPRTEWLVIEAEKAEYSKVLISWLLPLSLISAVAALIGFGVIGVPVGPAKVASMSLGLRQAVLQLVSMIGGAYLTAFIVNSLAEKYASQKNMDQALSLIAYAYTPACLGGIFQIIPSMSFIGSLAGLYSLYLLYIGLPVLMKTPPEKKTGYFVVSLLCTLGVAILLSTVLTVFFMLG